MSTNKTFIQLLKDDNQIELAKLYTTNGWGSEIDFKIVYDAVSQLKNSSIHNIIGYMHDEGIYVDQDYKKAFEYYKLSADLGNYIAQYNLGYMYRDGNGVDKDYKKAVEYYKLSADQGDSDAKQKIKNIGNWENIDEFITGLIIENKSFETKIQNLETKIQKLKDKNRELKYIPGNLGYKNVEKHFKLLSDKLTTSI